MRSSIFFFCFFISFFYNYTGAWTQTLTLVIDPGHGGRDPGTLRSKASFKHEKDINLLIALKLGNYIQQSPELKNVRVLYTRTEDITQSLQEKVDFANENKADYFISIHANSNQSKNIHGTESHIYSYKQKASLQLARFIQEEFETRAGRKSRGVWDARRRGRNLYVTQYTDMPSVLVECGYLTNPAEEQYLNSDYGQAIIASAIFRGFRTFVQSQPRPEDRSLYYRVQIMATRSPIDVEKVFSDLDETVVEYRGQAGDRYRYKYMIGREYDQGRADNLLRKIQEKGFEDAFLVAVRE